MSSLTYAPPSRNPADSDTLTGLLKLAFTKFLQKTDDMLPAEVVSYDSATNTAEVKPLIYIISTADQQIQRAAVASVPVYQISAGGFIVRLPVNKGDLGWIKANDRDISIFKQTNEGSSPNTQRKHSFEDALFYPQCAFDVVTIAEEDAVNMVIQNYAGTVKISLSQTSINMVAPTEINMTAPAINLNATTKLSLHSAANVSFDADGTGIVYTPSLITSYTNGVPTASSAPNPPGPL